MDLKHTFVFDGKLFQISVPYTRDMLILQKLPQEIGIQLLSNKNYTVKSSVRLEVFQGFLDYWSKSKEPEINSDNLVDYYLINEEFGFMIENFNEKYNENDLHLSFLCNSENYSINQPNILFDKSSHEQYIAMHLDSFIDNCADQILKIPISSLYNIFFHKERVLNEQQKWFDFIDKNKSQNPNLTLLLPSLDAQQLDREKVIDTVSKSAENFGFIPHLPQSFLMSNEKVNDYKKILDKIIGNLMETKNNDLIKMILSEDSFDVSTMIVIDNEKETLEIPPLHLAIELEDIELVKKILAKPELDINIKERSFKKYTSVHSIELFPGEEEKLAIDNLYFNEKTPLYHAIEKGNIEIIKELISREDLDINSKSILDIDMYTLDSVELSAAALKFTESYVESPETKSQSKDYLKKIFKYQHRGNEITALNYAFEKKNIEIVKLLFGRSDLDVNIKSVYGLERIRVELGGKILLDGNEGDEKTALYCAVESNDVDMVKFLLSHQNIDANTKLHHEYGNWTFTLQALAFFLILNSLIPPIFDKLSELHIPLDKQAIKYSNESGEYTVLHLAIKKGNLEIIKLLLSHNEIDINAKELNEKYTTIMLSESEQSEIHEKVPVLEEAINKEMEKLRSKGYRKERTALHIAVQEGNEKIVSLLLENKNIDIDATDEQGKKPVDLTNDQKIKSLLNKGHHH